MRCSLVVPITAALLIPCAQVHADPWSDLDAELAQRDGQMTPAPRLESDEIPEPLRQRDLRRAPTPPVPVPTPDEVQRAIPRPPLPDEIDPPLPVPERVEPPFPLPDAVDPPLPMPDRFAPPDDRPHAGWQCRQLAFGTHCWTVRCRRPAARRQPARPTGNPSCGGPAESRAFALLNAERRRQGLAQLACDPAALAAARQHSTDMCQRRYFSHWSPEGDAAGDRLHAAGARFEAAGENIAMGQLTAARAHRSWMNSPGHRRNILRPDYTRAAVGLVQCNGALPYWTQVFMR